MKMMLCRSRFAVAICAALTMSIAEGSQGQRTSSAHSRRLELEPLIGYQPVTQITDMAALDLDQLTIQERVGLGDFGKALKVYREGGHSNSFARINLVKPPPDKFFPAGTYVLGVSELGSDVFGTLATDTRWGEVNANDTITVDITYATSDEQSHHVDCMVGALYAFSEGYRHGCFEPKGQVRFIPVATRVAENFTYIYDTRKGNMNGRTIQRLSTEAAALMKTCDENGENCVYHDDYQLFQTYYGDYDYANKWIIAAATGNATSYSSHRGDADFSSMNATSGEGRAEAMQHGTVLLNIWMWVVHKMELAVHYCSTPCTNKTQGACESDAVAQWDQAVAYYAGSLEGQTGTGDGVLLYALADSRSLEFKTGGYLSDTVEGTSYVNLEITHLFNTGQTTLLSKQVSATKCGTMESIKDKIVNLMKVPLVQTVLRYAWKREFEDDDPESHVAKSAAYSAAILPYVFSCKPSHAGLIYNGLKVGSTDDAINFTRLKSTLEEIYSCLGVTCAQIGGLYTDGAYFDGADPCFDGETIDNNDPDKGNTQPPNPNATAAVPTQIIIQQQSSASVGAVLGITLAILMAIAICALAVLHMASSMRRKKLLEDCEQNNIAAVTAVAEVDLA